MNRPQLLDLTYCLVTRHKTHPVQTLWAFALVRRPLLLMGLRQKGRTRQWPKNLQSTNQTNPLSACKLVLSAQWRQALSDRDSLTSVSARHPDVSAASL